MDRMRNTEMCDDAFECDMRRICEHTCVIMTTCVTHLCANMCESTHSCVSQSKPCLCEHMTHRWEHSENHVGNNTEQMC